MATHAARDVTLGGLGLQLNPNRAGLADIGVPHVQVQCKHTCASRALLARLAICFGAWRASFDQSVHGRDGSSHCCSTCNRPDNAAPPATHREAQSAAFAQAVTHTSSSVRARWKSRRCIGVQRSDASRSRDATTRRFADSASRSSRQGVRSAPAAPRRAPTSVRLMSKLMVASLHSICASQ